MIGRNLFVILSFIAISSPSYSDQLPPIQHQNSAPIPKESSDVVGLVVENISPKSIPSIPITFGQAFLMGGVPSGYDLFAVIGGKELPVQADVKTRYPDGSVRMAVLSFILPNPRDSSDQRVMLVRRKKSTEYQAMDINFLINKANYNLSVDMDFHHQNGTLKHYHMDGAAILAKALYENDADYWLNGNIASEIRVDVPVEGSFHLIFDIRGYANGITHTDIQFANDVAMSNNGGQVTYDVSIHQEDGNGVEYKNLTQYQYQNWHYGQWSANVPDINLVRDVLQLESIGVIADYELQSGVSQEILGEENLHMNNKGFTLPLSTRDISPYMPMTGARPELGPTTRANAVWLITQNMVGEKYALAQADGAAAIPWHFWNTKTKNWLNTDDNPQIWADPRGGENSLTQPIDEKHSGWTPDTAHQPDLSFVPYLLTGSRFDLDELNAAASYDIVSAWPSMRDGPSGYTTHDNLIFGTQMRSAAWAMRNIDEAAWANPDGSVEKKYFSKVMNHNWRFVSSQIPIWTNLEGWTYGYIISIYGSGPGMAPWQQDYFSATAAQAAKMGNRDAQSFIRWSQNFIAGSILNLKNDGIANTIVTFPLNTPPNSQIYWDNAKNSWSYAEPLKTWNDVKNGMETAKISNDGGWERSDGDYGMLALMALSGIISVLPFDESQKARDAYAWLSNSKAPYIDQLSRRKMPEYNIIPNNYP